MESEINYEIPTPQKLKKEKSDVSNITIHIFRDQTPVKGFHFIFTIRLESRPGPCPFWGDSPLLPVRTTTQAYFSRISVGMSDNIAILFSCIGVRTESKGISPQIEIKS